MRLAAKDTISNPLYIATAIQLAKKQDVIPQFKLYCTNMCN